MAQALAGKIDLKVDVHGIGQVLGLGVATKVAGMSVKSFARGALMATTSTLALSAAAGAATMAVAGLAAPLAAMASAAVAAVAPATALGVALAPAALASAGAAVGVLAASFNGLGAAIDDSDPEKAAEALAQLPGPAQDAALALRDLKSQFGDLGSEIQGSFWANLSNIGDLAAVIEPIRQATIGLAADMGNAAAGVVDFVSQGTGLSAVKMLLDNSSFAASNLSNAFADVLKGIISVAAGASPFLSQLSTKIAEVASAWSEKMTAAFADGSMHQYFADGVAKLQEFGAFMGQLGGIVSGVWQAMNAAGAPFLGTLGQVVATTNEWVNSAQGMSTLVSFFSAMSAAVGALMPVLSNVAGIIGTTVAPMIASLVTTLAPALNMLVTSVGQGLQTISPLISAIGTAIAGLAPMLSTLVDGLAQGLSLIHI